MTNHTPDSTTIAMALELLTEHGLDGVAPVVEIQVNEAMQIDRSKFLQAGPHDRAEQRLGYAIGFRERSMKTCLGEIEWRISEAHELMDGFEAFCAKALERGDGGERALKLALALMYVEGMSTRKVTKITRELCSIEITSSKARPRATQNAIAGY